MPYRVLIEGGRTRNMYPTILSYGGGADSTALAIGLFQRGEIPDSIVFAAVGDFRSFPEGGDIRDLARIGIKYGDEMPETYEALVKVDDWLRDHGMPGITVITYVHLSDRYAGLYENCIANHTLPGISFGSPNVARSTRGKVSTGGCARTTPGHSVYVALSATTPARRTGNASRRSPSR